MARIDGQDGTKVKEDACPLGRITDIKELNNKLDVNPKLPLSIQDIHEYSYLTGISDKEIPLETGR
ncbi:MAG: hypothetical protein CM1200mP28_15140 [Deltaproteobacteria bacterium]|nr:MAG: hypothetical protein CM1200mP28_15140 [Deltaproteobacteria bacterium]